MNIVSNPPAAAPAIVPSNPAALALRRAARSTVLAYHELSSDATDYRYALSCRQFEEHLQLAARLRQPADAGPLVFSFDDGHISNYSHALSLLQKYSCKAIFFVIVGRIGERKDFMTWTHLKELVSLGHRIESHSWSHKFLTDCPDSDLHNELVRSRETLEDRLSIPVQALSAPHGRWNRPLLNACAAAGYHRLYTSDPWSSRKAFTPSGLRQGCAGYLRMEQVEVVGRLVMVQSMDSPRLLHWLTMGRPEAGLRRAQYALKRTARCVLGGKLYYQLWARFTHWNGSEDTVWNGGRR
jgi:peptidoglycan/xylan/chitin deacetylase (PgdA/CDA1 family)